MNHTGETTVTVGETGLIGEVYDDHFVDTYNPNTGGYPDNPDTGDGRGVWFALLMGSLGGLALVLWGPKILHMKQ